MPFLTICGQNAAPVPAQQGGLKHLRGITLNVAEKSNEASTEVVHYSQNGPLRYRTTPGLGTGRRPCATIARRPSRRLQDSQSPRAHQRSETERSGEDPETTEKSQCCFCCCTRPHESPGRITNKFHIKVLPLRLHTI